jgi:hypothetical protein
MLLLCLIRGVKAKEIVERSGLREKGGMPEPESKVNVYGLSLTRRKYVLIQVIAFVWMLALYGYWRHAGLQKSPHAFVRHFDLLLLAIYLYGVVETFVVLRKFKVAGKK